MPWQCATEDHASRRSPVRSYRPFPVPAPRRTGWRWCRSYAGSRADIVHTRSCKVRSQNGALKLRILLDKNSIEVFANDGEQTMTAWIYTPQSADGITFAADGKATVTAEQFELNL